MLDCITYQPWRQKINLYTRIYKWKVKDDYREFLELSVIFIGKVVQ